MAQLFPNVFARVDTLRNGTMKPILKPEYQITHHGWRRIPIVSQETVKLETDRLTDEGHFPKLDFCKEDEFIEPIAVTAKRDDKVKFASLRSIICLIEYTWAISLMSNI